ncbi:hypothetical protein SDC9_14677 [bioreactor metagenome]|uniref:Uncharacterized protein n=1 Tax=bioreactor metagenome TaxID=1076179 RepID=A0A644TPU4_9ZZZZ
MADFKENMYRRLRSARQWLTRAEEAFDKDRDVRAELNLMLAQAELQHAKEANRTRHWRYKYSLLTQGTAVGLAMMLAVIGFGGTYWWVNQQQTRADQGSPAVQLQMPQQVISVSNPAEQTKPQLETQAAQQTPTKVETEHQQTSTVAEKSRVTNDAQQYQAEQQVVLPPDELQKLVRAAGKTLRGQ